MSRHYTNIELYRAADASAANYSMPYVYDHFEWEHCEAAGYTL